MEQIRSFVAIELPDKLKQELVQLVDRLKAGGHAGVRWVDARNIHLTLKFLGNVVVGRLDQVTEALVEACHGAVPFRLAVGGLGIFPNARRTRVAWVGLSGDTAELQRLQQRLGHGLERLGFAAESRPFAPHLTLARVRDQASAEERLSFGQWIAGSSFTAEHPLAVDTICLMRSQLTGQGAVYSQISSAPLG